MRQGLERALSAAAILAIALHTVLWAAIMPFAAGTTTDPFLIICHSGSAAVADDATASNERAVLPSQACDHCSLCSTIAAPATPDMVLAGRLMPARLPHVLEPTAPPSRPSTLPGDIRPRGPPHLA